MVLGSYLLLSEGGHIRLSEKMSWLAPGMGIIYALLVFYLDYSGRASRRFLRINSAVVLIIVVVTAGFYFFNWVDSIYGVTPQSAAENIYDGMWHEKELQDYRFIEELSTLDESGNLRYVSYRVVDVNNLTQARVSVARYGWFWWTLASSRGVEPPEVGLKRAKELVVNSWSRDTGVSILREIISDHPGTPEAMEADRIITEMGY